MPTDSDTLTYDLGYSLGTAWFQTSGGGNIISGGNVTSIMSPLASPRYLATNGAGGSPGVLLALGDIDLDPDPVARGNSLVSVPRWQALGEPLPFPLIDWYSSAKIRFGGPTTFDSFPNQLALTKPAARVSPYNITGDIQTTGSWNIAAGESLTLIVDGSATIASPIRVAAGGFFGLITRGNITIDPRVGVPPTSSASVLDGIYLTSPTGIIQTGASTNLGTEKLVARGVFGGGSFLLQRNLAAVGANATTPAEVFIWEPAFLFSMPEPLKDMPTTWEEVAP